MSRESRRGGNWWCYTRSRRENGKIVRTYIGVGPVAEIIALRDEAARLERMAQVAAATERRAAVGRARAAGAALDREAKAALLSEMTAAGYHLHARSHWRKSRMSMD